MALDGAPHNESQRVLQSVWLGKGKQGAHIQEFAAHLYTVNTSNYKVNTHPPSFCYCCKIVLDKCLLHVAQGQQHTSFTSTVPSEWNRTLQLIVKHIIKNICDHKINYIHPKPPRAKKINNVQSSSQIESPQKDHC